MEELLARIGTPYTASDTIQDSIEHHPSVFMIREKGEPLYSRIHV